MKKLISITLLVLPLFSFGDTQYYTYRDNYGMTDTVKVETNGCNTIISDSTQGEAQSATQSAAFAGFVKEHPILTVIGLTALYFMSSSSSSSSASASK